MGAMKGKRGLALEMGADEMEFMRLLPAALGGLRFVRENGRIVVRDDGRIVEIEWSAPATRNLAALSLPVTRVVLRLVDFNDAGAERFLGRFRLAYQRGGG
jgi:hypothetical protein